MRNDQQSITPKNSILFTYSLFLGRFGFDSVIHKDPL